MKNMSNYKEQGSAHIAILAVLVAVIIGLVGFIFWQNFVNKAPESKDNVSNTSINKDDKKVAESSTAPIAKDGTIQGSLTYPSEGIPSDLEIHAINLDTNKEYVSKEHLKGAGYQYGVGYKLSVPEGRYHVFGILSTKPQDKAYYDQYVKCGMKVGCNDYSKIEVEVVAGKETADVMVGDWWNI